MKPAEVRAIRTRLNMSYQEFADRLGVHRRTVIKWEKGERSPGGPAVKLMQSIDRKPMAGKG